MVLYHYTGDVRWLADPYRPVRDVNLIANPAAGFSPEVQQEIRAAAAEIFAAGVQAPKIADPGPDRFSEMLDCFLGERVPAEYTPLLREDMGYDDGDSSWAEATSQRDRVGCSVVIVGAGVFGLCLASQLKRLDVPFTILERNEEVGGTWLNNRYPGCGVDTPNHFYAYSFAPNPGWRHYFSPRDELQAYLEAFATDHDLRRHIRFGVEFEGAAWNERSQRWQIEASEPAGSFGLESNVLVVATGHFNEPIEANFPGKGDFEGEILHTARWPDEVDLAGKRVGVIGTGATSMQLVPNIASEVASLTVFQRTPQWVRPVANYNARVEPAAQWLFEHVPEYARWYRFGLFWRYGDGLLRYLRKDPDWPHPERSLNRTNDRHRAEMTAFVEDQLADRPDLVEKCVPTYPPFAKRILIDNGWFETLRRPHVQLETEAIERFTPAGIRTPATEHKLDVIITATGFNVTNLAARFDIVGLHGSALAEDWADDNPTAYLGMAVPKFPNMFVMYGPNTNVGHGGSGMWLAENQSRYISSAIVAMVEERATSIDCRDVRRGEWTDMVDRLHEDLVWTHPGLTTYYRTAQGRVRSPMPIRLVDYWEATHAADLDDYHVTQSTEAS